MAAVLPSEENSYFATSGLRRSHSHFNFISSAPPYFPSSHLSEHYQPASKSSAELNSPSTSSSPHTAHADLVGLSYSSTPTTNLSITYDYDAIGLVELPEGNFTFLSFAQEKLCVHPEIRPDTHYDDNLELPPSPREGNSYAVSLAEHESSEEVSHETSGPETPEHGKSQYAEDDTAVSSRPSRQVDYLSNEWREEDIWSSWKYVVTRRGELPNSARLENASWRAWIKAKNNLKTTPPESINWLKDCDVTWLYGPLQPGPKNLHPTYTEPLSMSLSNTDPLLNPNKKSILKKRRISEVMFQRSLFTASLLKQATTAVKAQETQGILRLYLGRSSTDCFAYPFASCRLSEERKSVAPSQVKQCIAVEAKDNEDMINDHYSFDSDLYHGVMIRRVGAKKRPISRRKTLKPELATEGKTLAMLPSTTLKYREDTPESQETAMKHA
ncbi:uncharacterized protein FPOAC1_013918 [Fusarium poae]|uniref:uncharacterized protein n=1 Tax=Fusarium poae TaxID=36050 RepID=UPI001D054EC0|nr:uncharacterized protein FPOAC1_013918 [Fusarium poae]KAG8664211.1 hypothetical protein FPOAC1_013918 [Fusarium poae]